MRRCKIPPHDCRHKFSAPCCKDCMEQDCPVRCENNPSRCKCWSDKPKRPGRSRKINVLQVVYLHEQGMTKAEIARQLECSECSVYNILWEMGVGRHGKS